MFIIAASEQGHAQRKHSSSPVCVQELTTEVKAEMRVVLQQYGITQFKIRPVRRNYAFEQPGVAHAMQWVLKITYPATMPQLPLGLSGGPQNHPALPCYP